jgi:WD40 repeat protein
MALRILLGARELHRSIHRPLALAALRSAEYPRAMRTLGIVASFFFVAATANAAKVTGFQVTSDGKTVIVGVADNTVRSLSAADGKEQRKLSLTEVPMAVALSPNGKTLAVGGFAFLSLYESATGKLVVTTKDPLGHMSINGLAFFPDSKTVVAGGDGGRIRMFDTTTGKQVRELEGFKSIVNAVAISGDGKTIAAGGVDNEVRLWDATSGAAGLVMKGHKTWIAGLTFTADGKSIVSVDQNAHLFMWDRATGKQLGAMEGDNGYSYAVAASPDGKLLAWGVEGGAQLWDVASKKPLDKISVVKSVVTTVAFSPDNKTLFIGDYGGHVTAVDMKTKAPKTLL